MDVFTPPVPSPDPNPVVSSAVPPRVFPRMSVVLFCFGWLGVLTGLGFVTAAAQMVDHATVMGRYLPLFWVVPVLTLVAAFRQRPNVLGLSALGVFGLAVGAALDLGHRHPVAGRYEFWLAAAGVLVTVAGWMMANPSKPPA